MSSMNLRTHPYDDKQKWLEEYAKRQVNSQGYVGGGTTCQQGVSGYVGGGVSGQQGVSGSCGQSGIQGVQGESGYMHLDSNTVFNHDIRIDDMSLRQFVHNVPVQSIEDSVVKILEKYGLIGNGVRFERDGTTNFMYDSTIGYPINDDEPEKTFTLEEVIKIIESTPSTTQVVSMFNQWDNNTIVEAYKQQLIQKFEIL